MVMNKKCTLLSLICFTLLLNFNLPGQRKYWIKLNDKTGTPYSVSAPAAFLTQQSINRRTTYNIPLDNSDLPVNPSYVTQIKSVPTVTVLFVSKWMNGIAVSVSSGTAGISALATIRSFPFVSDTARVKRYHLNIPDPKKLNGDISTPVQRASKETASDTARRRKYGNSYWQSQQMNLPCLHEKGYKGQGMTIAVLDVGFHFVDTNPVFDSLRNDGRILGTRNFVNGGTEVYNVNGTHGTMVLSCMAANYPGLILGSAPQAKYWLLRTEDETAETISEEYNWIRGAEFADSVGADILTTSLGYTDFDITSQSHTYATLNGRTAPMSIASTMASRKGLFVLNAAGNEAANPWHYISVAGDADSICTVGAIDSAGAVAGFSGVGPTSDHRIKPDLVTRGSGSWVSEGGIPCFPGNGTSFATPILAGAVACYWQANRTYNNMAILQNLKHYASNSILPDNSQGWGVPNVCKFINPRSPNLGFDFTLYFNHTNSMITILINESTYDFISVEVYDLLGHILFSSSEKSYDTTINLDASTLSDSMYLVKVKTSQGTKIKKIIKF